MTCFSNKIKLGKFSMQGVFCLVNNVSLGVPTSPLQKHPVTFVVEYSIVLELSWKMLNLKPKCLLRALVCVL